GRSREPRPETSRKWSRYGRSAVAIASLARVAVSAFWGFDARLVNGLLAMFRARRMRVDTTTSDSGPVPRSHSPRFGSRLSRFIASFSPPFQGGVGGGSFTLPPPLRTREGRKRPRVAVRRGPVQRSRLGSRRWR